MEDIKREIYEQDAIEEKIAIAEEENMKSQGMKKCKECLCWVYEEDLYNGICSSCIDDIVYDTTPEEVMEYASTVYDPNDKDDNELILYTDYLFSRDELLTILKRAVKDACILDKSMFRDGIRNYIECDTGHYIDYLDAKGAI